MIRKLASITLVVLLLPMLIIWKLYDIATDEDNVGDLLYDLGL